MKKYKSLLTICLLMSFALTACSSKSKTDELYENKSEEEIKEYSDYVEAIRLSAESKYTLNDENVKEASEYFDKKEDFYKIYDEYRNNVSQVDTEKLYITDYMKEAKEVYDEMKLWGQKHGMLYTDGQQTKLEAQKDEIEPLVYGQSLDTNEIEDTTDINDVNNEEAILDKEIEKKLLEKEQEMLDALDDRYKDPDNFVYEVQDGYNQTEEEIREELSEYTTLDEVANYIDNHYVSYYDMSDEDIPHLFSLNMEEGSISQDEWNQLSVDEAKERAVQLLLFAYSRYNNHLDENAAYYNSDEYKQYLRETRDEYMKNIEREKEKLKEELLGKEPSKESNEYMVWRKAYEDNILYVETHDFTNEGLSEVIHKDDDGYYILWEDIYKFADENGKLPKNIEFLGFGQSYKIDTPDAPLTAYTDTHIQVIDWMIMEDSTGVKSLFISLNYPDIQGVRNVEFVINGEKLVYNHDNVSKLFN